MALRNNQNVVSTSLSTTYHGSSVPSLVPPIPDLYADRGCDTSAPGVHQFLAIDGNDFARLRREITAQELRNLRSPMKQMPVESFFFAVTDQDLQQSYAPAVFPVRRPGKALRNLLMAKRIKEVALVFILSRPRSRRLLPSTSARRT